MTEEVSRLKLHLDNADLKKAQVTKIKSRIEFLKMSIAYLEQGNREEYLQEKLDKIENRITLINQSFQDWVPTKYFEKDKDKLKEFQKEMGIPRLKLQRRALLFLLDK